METLSRVNEKKKRNTAGFIIGGIIGLAIIGTAVALLSFQPSSEEQRAAVLEGSFHEGSPEFAELTKHIIIATSDETVESPNAFGTISMFIVGNVRNKSDVAINGLEINVAVVDRFNQVIKEKRVLAVPTQQSLLEAGSTMRVTLSIDGFKKNDDRANIRWKVTAIRTL